MMTRVDELFDVDYGVNLELNALTITDYQNPYAVNFVSRTSQNNGVSAVVERIPDLEPQPAGTITVAGGGSVLETFLQPAPFYSGRDLFCLTPKIPMSDSVKLYYCACLRANKYKYNYGRQANKTLRSLLIPSLDEIPKHILSASVPSYQDRFDHISSQLPCGEMLASKNSKLVPLSDIFKVMAGNKLDFGKMRCVNDGIAFISRTSKNNGLVGLVEKIDDAKPFEAGLITVSLGGTYVLSSFVQPEEFYTAQNVAILEPKIKLTLEEKLYYCCCIKQNRFRYSAFGREANRTLKDILVPDYSCVPDFVKKGIEI